MDGRAYTVFTAVQVVAVTAALWIVFSRPGPWDLQRCAGSGLMIAGIAGIAAARYQLGKSFSVKAEAHELVTRGVYSKVRNPIYVFGVVMVSGIVLTLHRPLLWLLLPVIIILQVLRARREAAVLKAAFGDDYRNYRRQTWF